MFTSVKQYLSNPLSKKDKQQNNKNIIIQKQLPPIDLIYGPKILEELMETHVINETNDIVLYTCDRGYYIPEEEILILGLNNKNFDLKIEKLLSDKIFIGELPILRINNLYFNKDQFIDLLLKLYCKTYKEFYSINHLYLIHLCQKNLQNSTKYFMWIFNNNYQYRDPYSLFCNPIKKLEHILQLRKLNQSLKYQNIGDVKSASQNAIICLKQLQYFYQQHKCFHFGPSDEQIQLKLTDIIVYCYIKQISFNVKGSYLFYQLENYQDLKTFYYQYQDQIKNFNQNTNGKKNMKIYQKIKQDKSKEENKNLDFLREVIIPFILITTFSYTYAFK